ncbi:MAG: FAD-dependent oxidoreductase [Bacillota bacterium]|nr:FAD-dependent oxidoreductase [Bacillota bacterium]
MDEKNLFDLVILGGGPAGTTAALYGVRAGLSVTVIENKALGGEIVSTDRLDNFPAFPDGITGFEFGLLLEKQMENLRVPVHYTQIEKADLKETIKRITTSAGVLEGRAVLLATGTEPNLLGVKGEVELCGRGVSYCATCDAAFFRDKEVAVVGGGNAALEEAIFLDRFASKIYLIHRRDQFRGVKGLQDKVLSMPGIEVLWNTTVSKIEGEQKVERLVIMQDGQERELDVEGVFIYAGRRPNTEFIEEGIIETDKAGYIITSEKMETSLSGVYAAGDIRRKFLRQVITAAADGAIAATAAAQHIFA